MSEFKVSLHQQCIELVNEKLESLEMELHNLANSAASDTKSSMGDKYETGREMINLEKGKIGEQLSNAQFMLQALNSLEPSALFIKAELGALVTTNLGMYYLSAPLGRLKQNGTSVFCISMGSPIGQQMVGKSVGDEFVLAGKTQRIIELQ